MIYGSLVDCLLFTPDEFDDRFVIGDFDIPTPQMKIFTENLVIRVYENSQLPDDRKESFEETFRWAYNDTKYDAHGNEVAFKLKSMTVEAVMEKFEKECRGYYDYLIDVRVGGKMLATQEMYSKARLAVDRLIMSAITGPIISQENDYNIDVYKQLIILFEYMGIPFKSMVDLVHVNHSNRTIQPYDLKTTHNAEEFPHSYIKFNYYIQAGVYHLAIHAWACQQGLQDYKILPMAFIVTDSYNYMSPLVYITADTNLRESIYGFTIGNRKYRGTDELLEELKWHKENGTWDISYTNYRNKGVVKLKPFEDEDNGSKEEEDKINN